MVFSVWGLWGRRWVGSPWWGRGEVAQYFSGGGVDDGDVVVLGEDEDAGSVVVAADADVNYPRFCSYSVARAGVGWLAGCEVPVRAASYSAGLW